MDCRCNAVRLIGFTAKQRQENSGGTFTILVNLIKSDNGAAIRLAAAYALKNDVPLDATRAVTLRNIRDQLADKRIAAVLTETLDRFPQQ
jgi:hypothetical protein